MQASRTGPAPWSDVVAPAARLVRMLYRDRSVALADARGSVDVLPDWGAVGDQGLHPLGGFDAGDFPGGELFEVHELGFVAVLIDVLYSEFSFAGGGGLGGCYGHSF